MNNQAAQTMHPDALPDGTLSKSTAKRLAAASVSERARELLAGVYRDSGYLYEADILEAGVVDSIDECALRAIEMALTKPILPSVKTFASAVWRDWMTNEQADRLGAELHAWLGAHVAVPEQALTQQLGLEECDG